MPFTNEAWSSPRSDLEASAYCACCLLDTNPPGQDKVKALCKLPVRSTPSSPYNRNALRNAASRIFQVSDVQPAAKKKAARRLVRLMREADISVSSTSLLRLAGMRGG